MTQTQSTSSSTPKIIEHQVLTGERALFKTTDVTILYSIFQDGESPLKESKNLDVRHCMFNYKYPFWYCENVSVEDSTWFDMARAGVWYTKNMSVSNSVIEAPKNFRKASNIKLTNVTFTNAAETFWNCDHVLMNNVTAKGDYFAMGSTDLEIDGLILDGNYGFDSCKNVVIKNAHMLTKDAFWNCENVTVYDSVILGQYLGWNSKNVRLVNCTVQSEQGMCYMENLVMENCKVLNSDLTFEYSTVEADITTQVTSIKNPISGTIRCAGVGELIFDDPQIDPSATKIITR